MLIDGPFCSLFHRFRRVEYYSDIYVVFTQMLDPIDLQILSQLQSDSALSNLELAQRVHISPPTCLRRVKRLRDAGLIEREMAILDPERVAREVGFGLEAIVEVSLDRQGQEAQEAFEARVIQDDAVQQCYRVSPGPDFVLVVAARDMPDYLALAQRLFTTDANVRNVKAFFSLKRSKFAPRVLLPQRG